MPVPLQQKRVFYFAMAALGGFLLWYCSPQWFGHREPWDGNVIHYVAALFTLGFGLRLLFIALPMSVYYGTLVGQFLGILYPHFAMEPLLPLGALFIFMFTLFAYFGAWVGQHIR